MTPASLEILTATQLRTERRDGPRYTEALNGVAPLRWHIWRTHWWHLPESERVQRPWVLWQMQPVTDSERLVGIPAWK